MPYINKHLRAILDPAIDKVLSRVRQVEQDVVRPGILNYVISRIVSETVHNNHWGNDWSYNEIAEVVSAFDCAKLEFYRRVAAPKEDEAIRKNGDIPAYGGQ